MFNAKLVKVINDRKLYQNQMLLLKNKFNLQLIEINVKLKANEDLTKEVIFI